MRGSEEREQMLLRRLARDQWVRLHGTPRVTVLAGGEYARQLWHAWLSLAGVPGTLLEGKEVDAMLRTAIHGAVASPARPIAVLASKQALSAWRAGRTDRDAAMVDEGLLEVPEPARAAQRGAHTVPLRLDARSAAEAALFEALEATPATRGRFRLNESLSVRFGPRAAEVDLLSREDAIAIEIDGIHHFADPDCYRRDRRKDLLLQTQGLLVIRLLAEDVLRDPREGVNVVCRALAYRLDGRTP
jgi:very-short-patch-repair endonuclease